MIDALSGYVLSIAGIVLFSCIVDFILPMSQINKNIKLVFSLATILVIILPLPKLLKTNFNLNDYFVNTELNLQEDYLYQNNMNKLNAITLDLENGLSGSGYINTKVSLSCNIFDLEFKITSANVDMSQAIYSNNKTDDEISVEIKNIVKRYIEIDTSQIFVNF